MAVTDFSTKAAVVVRDDLAPWQRLNVTGFLVSGLIGAAEPEAIGEPYEDGDGVKYLPLLVQPLLVFEASAEQLRRARERAASRGVTPAIYTAQMFSTGNDGENRAAVRAVATDELDLVGIGIRTGHRDADAVLRGLRRHP
ncbi:MAG: DUF2000 family protein [Solirubrobacteraceae bacterium]|jgi:hypothetical protein